MADGDRKRSNPTPEKGMIEKKGTKIGIIVVIAAIIIIAAASVMLLSPPAPNNGQTPDDGTPTENPIAVISTSMGTIRVELFQDEEPNTVANFIKLANDGFYNGLIFHRIGSTFMIQGGGFNPDGTQKQDPYGPINLETNTSVTHVDGAISMARTTDPNSATSQFFICVGAQHFLDGQYAAFGVTIEGLEVVKNIAAQPTDNSGGDGTGKPLTDILINSITIENQ
jgi:cyclophilin family peptidyl-prolyl cis-trans isomerase